jgi:hypothetical protein
VQSTVVQDANAVSQREGFGEIVRNQEDGPPKLVL